MDAMSQHVLVKLEMPADLDKFTLPQALNERLQDLLDRQDKGEELLPAERMEANGLVNLAELLSLLRLRSERVWLEGAHSHELYPREIATARNPKSKNAL